MRRGDETRSGIENVLPTCKAVTYRGDQRIIAVLFGSEKRAHRKKFNITLEKNNIMSLYFFGISYSSFGTEIAKWSRQSQQPCKFLTGNNTGWTIDRVYRLHLFCRTRTLEDYRSYDVDKNY